jgi:hypothetical protein
MVVIGENRSTWRKPCASATFSTINPTYTGLGLNMGLCSDRLASNHLSLCIIQACLKQNLKKIKKQDY